MSRRLIPLLLLGAAIVPYFIGLGDSSIWDANEAFYVETPREMIERGDFVSPSFNYEPRFNKPVLSYWIVAGFYKMFGLSVGVQRVPIALGAMGLIAVAFVLALAATPHVGGTGAPPRASSAQPRAPSLGVDAALWAALGLAIAPRLLMFARRIFIDIYISLFMALTLMFFALAERYPGRRRVFLVLMYVSVGLGMLTKGPVAVALPGLVFAAYLVVHGELRRITETMIPLGTAIVLAIVVPWYAVLYQRYGWTYITSFFIGENVARYTAGVGFQGSRGPFFYVPVVLTDSFPWAVFLFAGGWAWLRDRRTASGASPDAGFRIRTLLWLWIAVIVLFFSFSASKQDLYIFPIVPAIAALAGTFIARSLAGGGSRRALSATVTVIGVLLAVTGVALIWLFNRGAQSYAIEGAMLVAGIGIVGGLAVVALAWRSRNAASLIALAATMIALNWTFVLRVLPSFEVYKPVPRLAAVLIPRLGPSDTVATYDVALPSMVYYLRRHVAMLFKPGELVSTLRSDGRVYAVLTRDDYRALAPAFGLPTCEIASAPTFDVKLKNVLSREPLPELVVITNTCR